MNWKDVSKSSLPKSRCAKNQEVDNKPISRKRLWIIPLVCAILIGSTAINSHTAVASTAPTPVTPIKHIVIIIQENHSFDNYFGTLPGVPQGYGLNLNACLPSDTKGKCVRPWNADDNKNVQATDIPHTSGAAQHDYDRGKMDGFVTELQSNIQNYSMAYYNGNSGGIPTYWNYATYYDLDDYFFQSAMSMSLPNHLYAVAASDGCTTTNCLNFNGPTEYNLTFPQIAEYLTPLGITWAYYQYGWEDSADCTGPYTSNYVNSHLVQGDSYWTGLTEFTQVQISYKNPVSGFKAECSSLQNYNDLMNSIKGNTLPDVSWVIPESSLSDHPGQSLLSSGQNYIASIVNAIGNSPAWNSTVIFLTDDEWGGYYDQMVPLQVDSQGVGFRIPLIAISPYAMQGKILHLPSNYTITSGPYKGKTTDQEDFSALISTIEYNWDLTQYNSEYTGEFHLSQGLPLTARDQDEPNLFFMLNFSQKPLAPLIQPTSGNSVYPYQTCISEKICSTSPTNADQAVEYYTPAPYAWTESYQQALNYSGTGDADD